MKYIRLHKLLIFFSMIETWWLKEGLDLRVVTFTCVPTGFKQGTLKIFQSYTKDKNNQSNTHCKFANIYKPRTLYTNDIFGDRCCRDCVKC